MSNLEDNKTNDEVTIVEEETSAPASNPDAPEAESIKETNQTSEYNVERKSKASAAKVTTTIAATAVVAFVSYSVISSSGLINLSMDAKINSVEFVDDGLDYDINVSEVKVSNEIYFSILYNDESVMKYTVDIDNDNTYTGQLTGHFALSDIDIASDLELANGPIEYTVRLCGNTGLVDRTYDSWIVEVSGLVSEFYSVTYEYQYDTTGYFVFQMDYIDNLGQFTDFKATLTDTNNAVSECTFTENFHDEQKISVLGLASEVTFTISANINNKVDSAGELVYDEMFSAAVTL
ncbi:MAG: hypothetical protein K6A63_01440 [Acholeplasmatales bacterium]|nr:hypothetical protein [Acholeplasmatales bacterium]